MRSLKIIFCIGMVFLVATMSGCGNVIKGAISSVSKGASKTAQKAVKHADTVLEVAEIAYDANSSKTPNTPNSTRPVPNAVPTSRGSAVAKIGAAVTGGAIVASGLRGEALTGSDLSLGMLSIDDRAEKVTAKLGKSYKVSTDSDGGKRMTYNDVEVVVKQGRITALVSQSSAMSTPRGIHEGSPVQEVFDRYGENYIKTEYDKQTLYEYEITSSQGHECLLRFAVNNVDGKVGYISQRLAHTESQSQAADNSSSAEKTFINYHKAITDGNYREAYEMLSYAQRDRMGSYDSYVTGFKDTISSEVTDLKLVSSDEDTCTFNYTLTARDHYQGNRVKIQTFEGQVTMAKDDGRWYVREAKSSKVNERYE